MEASTSHRIKGRKSQAKAACQTWQSTRKKGAARENKVLHDEQRKLLVASSHTAEREDARELGRVCRRDDDDEDDELNSKRAANICGVVLIVLRESA